MKRPDYIPENYGRIEIVDGLQPFFNACAAACAGGFGPAKNAVLWPRRLSGDFNTLALSLAERYDVQDRAHRMLDLKALEELPPAEFTPGERQALSRIIEDMRALAASTLVTPHGMDLRVLRKYGEETVRNFHGDGTSRICCAYNEPVTEWVRNDDLEGSSLPAPKKGAFVYSFKPGDLWCHYGGAPVREESFYHRGPDARSGQARLLLVADTYSFRYF